MSSLTPELRAQIEQILQAAGDDTRHGMAYRSLLQGLSAEQVAKEWDRSKSYAVMVMRSVRYLLDGELPRASSMTLTNSYAYRELLDYNPSDELRAHATACLDMLKERNREVKVAPMGQVALQSTGARRPKREVRYCSQCFLTMPCECE